MTNAKAQEYLKQLYSYLLYLIKNEKERIATLSKQDLVITANLQLIETQKTINSNLNDLLIANSLNEHNVLTFNKVGPDAKFDDLNHIVFNAYLNIPVNDNGIIKILPVFMLQDESQNLNDISQIELTNQMQEIKADLTSLENDLTRIFYVFAFCKLYPVPLAVLEKIKQASGKQELNFETLFNVVSKLSNYKQTIEKLKTDVVSNLNENKPLETAKTKKTFKDTLLVPNTITTHENIVFSNLLASKKEIVSFALQVANTQLEVLNKLLAFFKKWISVIDLDSADINSTIYINNIDVNNNYKFFAKKWTNYLKGIANNDFDAFISAILCVNFNKYNGQQVTITLLNEVSNSININSKDANNNSIFHITDIKKRIDGFMEFDINTFLQELKIAQTLISEETFNKTNYSYEEFKKLVASNKGNVINGSKEKFRR